MSDPTPPADPPVGVAEELGIDDSVLARQGVSLVVSGGRRGKVGEPVDLRARDAQAQQLQAFLRQFF